MFEPYHHRIIDDIYGFQALYVMHCEKLHATVTVIDVVEDFKSLLKPV